MWRRGLLCEEHELGAGLEVPHVLLVGEHDVRHLEQGEAEARRLGQLARSNKVRGRPPCQRRPDLSCFDFGEEEEAAAPLPVAKPKDKGKGKAAQRAAEKAEEEAQRELRIAQAKAEPASSVRCRQPGEPAALGDFVDWALEQQELAGCPGPEDLLAANIATGCSLDPISFLRRDTSASRSLTPPHTASRTRHRSLAAASSRMRMRSHVHRRPQAGARRPLRPHQGGDRVQQHAAAAGEPDV